MLSNAYFLAKIAGDTAENEQNFAEIALLRSDPQPVAEAQRAQHHDVGARPAARAVEGNLATRLRARPPRDEPLGEVSPPFETVSALKPLFEHRLDRASYIFLLVSLHLLVWLRQIRQNAKLRYTSSIRILSKSR